MIAATSENSFVIATHRGPYLSTFANADARGFCCCLALVMLVLVLELQLQQICSTGES